MNNDTNRGIQEVNQKSETQDMTVQGGERMARNVMAHEAIYTKQFKTWDSVPAIITLNDASILLQIPEDTLRRHLESGAIPGTKIGRQWRLDKEKIKNMFT